MTDISAIKDEAGTVNFLAGQFVDVIHEWTTPEEFEQIKQRNRTNDASVCATHDFMDANEAMDEAFRRALGRSYDMESDADTALWNEAWEIAVKGWLS